MSRAGRTATPALAVLRVQRWVAACVLAVGLALLAMMVTTEGEPGLLPLVLVAVGGTWLGWSQVRIRRRR
jgi:hypothetical protein